VVLKADQEIRKDGRTYQNDDNGTFKLGQEQPQSIQTFMGLEEIGTIDLQSLLSPGFTESGGSSGKFLDQVGGRVLSIVGQVKGQDLYPL
jgi:hypothetical protein